MDRRSPRHSGCSVATVANGSAHSAPVANGSVRGATVASSSARSVFPPSVSPLSVPVASSTLAEPLTLDEVGTSNEQLTDISAELNSVWITLVWNDPVNLMSYVAWVFRSYFGFSRREAERRMLQVHNEGRAVVATGTREEMERHVEAMHDFGLWSTLEKIKP